MISLCVTNQLKFPASQYYHRRTNTQPKCPGHQNLSGPAYLSRLNQSVLTHWVDWHIKTEANEDCVIWPAVAKRHRVEDEGMTWTNREKKHLLIGRLIIGVNIPDSQGVFTREAWDDISAAFHEVSTLTQTAEECNGVFVQPKM